MGVIVHPAVVLPYHSVNHLPANVTLRDQHSAVEPVFRQPSNGLILAEPILERHAVPQLGPSIKDLMGHDALQGLSVKIFGLSEEAHLPPRRDPCGIFHQPMVQQGQPALHREDPQQLQSAQVEIHQSAVIAVQAPAESISPAVSLAVGQHAVISGGQIAALQEFAGAQLTQLFFGIIGPPAMAEQIPGKGQAVGEALGLHLPVLFLVAVGQFLESSPKGAQNPAGYPVDQGSQFIGLIDGMSAEGLIPTLPAEHVPYPALGRSPQQVAANLDADVAEGLIHAPDDFLDQQGRLGLKRHQGVFRAETLGHKLGPVGFVEGLAPAAEGECSQRPAGELRGEADQGTGISSPAEKYSGVLLRIDAQSDGIFDEIDDVPDGSFLIAGLAPAEVQLPVSVLFHA